MAGHLNYHVNVIKLPDQCGLPHLTGVPHLHVNRPFKVSSIGVRKKRRLSEGLAGFEPAVLKTAIRRLYHHTTGDSTARYVIVLHSYGDKPNPNRKHLSQCLALFYIVSV